MPCEKIEKSRLPYVRPPISERIGPFKSEKECLEACREGACCRGLSCSIKPQCECDPALGFTFMGSGTTCSPNPCIVGACCQGPNCSQNSRVLCGGVYVGDNINCSPNPCCPGCVPPTQQDPSGKCCRDTYINDGFGSCCPRDCCNPENGVTNGGCCPENKPYCCTPIGVAGIFPRNKKCQSVPPTPCSTNFIVFRGPCAGIFPVGPTPRRFSFNVESGQFTMRFRVGGGKQTGLGGAIVLDSSSIATLRAGNIVLTSAIGGAFTTFCKPAGITNIDVEISDVTNFGQPVLEVNDCVVFEGWPPDINNTFSLWNFIAECVNGCQCEENPLP